MLIYKATINNKSYVGLFSGEVNNFGKRKREHKGSALNKRDKSYFHNAIRKYGWNNVQWKILEDKIPNINILNKREQFYIKKLKTFVPKGYNLTLGGYGCFGYKQTKKHKEKIRKALIGKQNSLGRKLSDETKKKMSLSGKGKHNVRGKNNPMYGKKHSEKSKKIMRNKAKRRYNVSNNSN